MGFILTSAVTMACPHGGSITVVSSNTRAKASGAFILRPSDSFIITGCQFTVPPSHPCVTVEWQMPAMRTRVGGNAVLTRSSIGLCKAADQAVQGVVVIQLTQAKVRAQ